MRVAHNIPHPFLVVEIFTYAEKYSLKIKFRGLEQSFPIPREHVEAIVNALSDPGHFFYRETMESFSTMQKALVEMTTNFQSGEVWEEDIV